MTRKRVSKMGTSPKKAETKAGPAPINQMDANLFQQLIQISNQYGKLKQQKDEFSMVLNQVKQKREEIATGKIALPILMPLGKNKFYNCTDKKLALEDLDAEIQVLSNAVKGIDGQLLNYTDAYVEAGLRVSDFLTSKFGDYKPKTPYTKGCSPKKEERVLFEAELDDMLKDEEKVKEFKAAKKTAIEENKK